MKRWILLAFVVCLFAGEVPAQGTQPATAVPTAPAPGPAATQASAVFTLQQCIDAALAAGDDVKILQGTLDVATMQYAFSATKAAFSLSGNAGYGLTDNTGNTTLNSNIGGTGTQATTQSPQAGVSLSGPLTTAAAAVTQVLPVNSPNVPSTSVVDFSLTQTLWDGYPGGKVKATVDKSFLALKGQELVAVQSRWAAIAKVKQAYVTMLNAQRTLSVNRQVLDTQNSLLKQISATYDLKQASAIDLMTAKINARSAQLDVKSGEHDLSLARQRLANIIGRAADQDFAVEEIDQPQLPAPSLAEAISVGLATRQDIAQIDLSRRSSGIDLVLARGLAQPNVSLTGGLAWGYAESSPSLTAATANVGLKISMPILDAGAAKSEIDASMAQIGVYSVLENQLRLSIMADIRDAFESAAIQAERIDLAKQSVDMNNAQFQLVKTEYSFGTATNQDLLTAAVNAANAEAAYATARSNYLLAVLQLETTMGL